MADLEPTPVESEVVVEQAPPMPPVRPRKVYAGMWGPLEIAAVSAGALFMLAVTMVYFVWVLPSNRELARNKSEADRLDAELISAKSKYGEITSSETQVAKLVASVDDFETQFLPLPANGQAALYQRLNGLIAAYGLVNTTGPDYAPLQIVDQNDGQQTDEEKGRAKFRSLYPGVYVSTTVEGSYADLRRFIREIETGRDFIIVSSVELAPTETEKPQDQTNTTAAQVPNTPDPARPGSGGVTTFGGGNPRGPVSVYNPQPVISQPKPKGKMHGETVSLHIELAAYFRRPEFVPQQ